MIGTRLSEQLGQGIGLVGKLNRAECPGELKPHVFVVVFSQAEEALRQRRHAGWLSADTGLALGQKSLGQADGMRPHDRRNIGGHRDQIAAFQCVQSGQRVKRVHSPETGFAPFGQAAQRLDGRLVLPLEQQPRRRAPMPAVRVIERLNQLGHSRLAKPRQLRLNKHSGHNPVNPATVVATVEVDVLLDAVRKRPRVLDHFAVHIGNVKRAVRADLHLHRPKPVVGRGEELPVAFIVGALRGKFYPMGTKFFSMNQVAPSVGDESVAAVPAWPSVPVVNRHAGCRREITGRTPAALHRPGHLLGNAPARADDPPRLVRAEPKHRCRGAVHRDVHQRRLGHEVRIRAGVALLVHHLLNVMAVAADELPPGRVEVHPVLRAAVLQTKLKRARVEGEIRAHERNRSQLRLADNAHLPRRAAGRAVDAIVESPAKAVHERLHVEPVDRVADAGKDNPPLVGLSVAVGVLQIKNVRRHADEHAAVVAGDRRWPGEVAGINRRAVKVAVAVGVLEQAHLAKLVIAMLRVADHLDDKQPAVLIERHRHRIGDQRLGSSQFQPKTGLERKSAKRSGRLGRFQARKIPLGGLRLSGGNGQTGQTKASQQKNEMAKHRRNQKEKWQNSKKNIISIDIVEINGLHCLSGVAWASA